MESSIDRRTITFFYCGCKSSVCLGGNMRVRMGTATPEGIMGCLGAFAVALALIALYLFFVRPPSTEGTDWKSQVAERESNIHAAEAIVDTASKQSDRCRAVETIFMNSKSLLIDGDAAGLKPADMSKAQATVILAFRRL